jgi:hypothetical protein
MALVHSDKIKYAYLTRNDISNEWIVLDNQKSVEKRAKTIWELLSDVLINTVFEPKTDVFEELHSEYICPIKIPHSRVATFLLLLWK